MYHILLLVVQVDRQLLVQIGWWVRLLVFELVPLWLLEE
jgi:hypothetical protein